MGIKNKVWKRLRIERDNLDGIFLIDKAIEITIEEMEKMQPQAPNKLKRGAEKIAGQLG